jgi:hypothetical protein
MMDVDNVELEVAPVYRLDIKTEYPRRNCGNIGILVCGTW